MTATLITRYLLDQRMTSSVSHMALDVMSCGTLTRTPR